MQENAPNRRNGYVPCVAVSPFFVLLPLALAAACAEKTAVSDAAPPVAASPSDILTFAGRCDGSAAVAVGGKLLATAPVVNGRALLVPLLNPEAITNGTAAAQFGAPIFLDVSGGDAKAAPELGVRDMAWCADRKVYVVLAGSYLAGGRQGAGFRLLTWDGKNKLVAVPGANLAGLTAPEAVFIKPSDKARVLVLSDDGSVDDCKAKPDDQRRFHRRWVRVP